MAQDFLSVTIHLRILCSAFLAFSAMSCKGQNKAPAGNTKTVAVAFYNLENLYDPADDPTRNDEEFTPTGANHYTEKIYREKLHNMAFALSRLATDKIQDGPALIGLAEIENKKVLQDLVHEPELDKRKLRIVHFDSPDNRGIDVALLYNPKYFSLLSAKALPVTITDKGHNDHTRDVLYVTGILVKDTVHVLVNHWPSRREGEDNSAWKRARVALENQKVIAALTSKNKNAKCIVMGDLNDDPTDESVTQTLGAEGNRQKVKPGGLYNPWVDIYRSGKGTAAYRNHWNLFDQIIVSYGFLNNRGSNLKFSGAEIFNADFLKNSSGRQKGYPHRSFSGNRWINGYSDHFPTIIYLSK